MLLNDKEINAIAGIILTDYNYLFPSTYPDIPLNLAMLRDALNKAGIETEKNEIPDIMQRVELMLAAMVPLNWNNYGTIAILLDQKYPDEDLLAISEQKVMELTRALLNFSDKGDPEADIIDSIIYTWISLTDEELGFSEDDSWS
ncbi:MAG: Fe-S cluster assembly protein IscX [Lentimicrobium sp.]|nr:Fe-S cluster assembly protein IscX [Lentimicrobium sp.]